jgi:hypothetical protein
MRIILAVGAVVALMIPMTAAFAQNPTADSIEKQKKDAAAQAEQAYQKALRDTRSQTPTAKADPWGNVRAADPKQGQQSK